MEGIPWPFGSSPLGWLRDFLQPMSRRKHCDLEEQLNLAQQETKRLAAENKYWEEECKRLQEDLRYYKDWWYGKEMRISSPLTQFEEHLDGPKDEGHEWKWYASSCPCCRRPLDITVRTRPRESQLTEETQWRGSASVSQYAYACVMWGTNPGYALGAAVLGARLKELQKESGEEADLVLMHTDDVPENYLRELGQIWTLQQTEYIDGVAALYTTKGTRFDGVFTKLNAWNLVQYEKVLLLDIDTFPLKSLHELFNLEAPAAFIRGNGSNEHGEVMDGRSFFLDETWAERAWQQAGGINAGVILLQPSEVLFQQMLKEVTSENHPAHIAGNGPEQDYLTRFFAADLKNPWRHIDVSYNFQLHHVPFALEKVIEHTSRDPEYQEEWKPRRLNIDPEEIKLIHFSGELKYWHMLLSRPGEETSQMDNERFAEMMMSQFASYNMWVTGEDDCCQFHCHRDESGRIILNCENGTTMDVSDLVERSFQHVRGIAVSSISAWRFCAESLMKQQPGLLDEVKNPQVAQNCWAIDTAVEVQWPKEGDAWHVGRVAGVHEDGSYTVHYHNYDRCSWITHMERRVSRERMRLLEEVRGPAIPFEELEVGKKYQGLVRFVVSYGAFVDVGTHLGLLHQTRISLEAIDCVNDVLYEGQQVDVWVTEIKEEERKFSLTMVEGLTGLAKDLTPFADLAGECRAGVVSRIVPFGVFVTVTLDSGAFADGLVHKSKIKDGFIENLEDVVSLGQEVKVKIETVDLWADRMTLVLDEGDGFRGPVLCTFQNVAEPWLPKSGEAFDAIAAPYIL